MPDKVTQVRAIPWKTGFDILVVLGAVFFMSTAATTQNHPKNEHSHSTDQKAFGEQISGMYTFLREGEFVQVTVEEGTLSGFVSRYGDRESDKDAFLDQFFSKGSIDGKKITFTTKPVHGTWFEFAGEVGRGSGKAPDQEGYWVIRGTLKQYDEDELKHVTSKSREITFKSFPQDAQEDQPK